MVVPLGGAGRVVLTLMSGPAEVWATIDGSLPVQPQNGVVNSGAQVTLAGVAGAQAVLQAPLFGDHMAAATVRIASAGTPVVEISW